MPCKLHRSNESAERENKKTRWVYAGSEEVGGMQHPFAVYISIPSVAILTTGFPIIQLL